MAGMASVTNTRPGVWSQNENHMKCKRLLDLCIFAGKIKAASQWVHQFSWKNERFFLMWWDRMVTSWSPVLE